MRAIVPSSLQTYDELTMLRGGSPLATCAMAVLLVACSEDGVVGNGIGGGAGVGGRGGSGIDDPSRDFDIVDPQAEEQGMELPAGTETALPPDEDIRAFFRAVEADGGEPFLLFDHTRDGQLLNVRIEIPEDDIVVVAGGAAYVDVDIGPVTIRVANTVDSTTTLPLLLVSATDLSQLVLLKSYSRELRDGALGPVTVDFASAFDLANEGAGPMGSLDLSNEPQVNMEGDCDSMAWELASEVPAMAVNFPPMEGCSESECVIVKAAWIRANHDVMRIRQMIEHLDSKAEAQREFLWDKPAVDPEGDAMGAETSLQYYFGGFSQYRFEAIRWVYKRLWDDMHDHDIQGLALDFECNPGGGDVCNTVPTPGLPSRSAVEFALARFTTGRSFRANRRLCPSLARMTDTPIPETAGTTPSINA